MEDYERIELRSEKIRHIIGAMPPWILRYGIAIVCTVVAILVGTTAFIPYPETIEVEVIIGNTQDNKRIATAFVNYNEISKVSTGMEIFLYPEGYTSDPQYTLTGEISAIDRHVIDNAGTRTFTCHIILCNNEILQEIALAINNSSTTTNPTIKYDITKLVEFVDATQTDNSGTRTVANGEIIQVKNVQEKIQIEFKFKIKSPENDSLPLQLRIVDRHNNAHKFNETQSLSLNKQQNSIETVKYTIDTTNFARSIYEITLNNIGTEICCFTLSYLSNTVLHFGPHRIKMTFVSIDNSYISETPLLDAHNRPITGLTANNIRNLLSEWEKAYGVAFKLPKSRPKSGFKVSCSEETITKLHTTHPEYFEI